MPFLAPEEVGHGDGEQGRGFVAVSSAASGRAADAGLFSSGFVAQPLILINGGLGDAIEQVSVKV